MEESVGKLNIEVTWSHSKRIHAVARKTEWELMMEEFASREAQRVGINELKPVSANTRLPLLHSISGSRYM